MRSVLYRFPDLDAFERLAREATLDPEFPLPPGETADDGEWVLAIFELGPGRRATSAAGRAAAAEDGTRLLFEPRDVRRLLMFAAAEARSAPAVTAPSRLASDEAVDATRLVPGSRPGPAAPPRVLLVDDDPDVRDVSAAMLESVGLSVASVDSAEAALARLAVDPFDLLVLDWSLPKMSGLDLCRAVRADAALARLPVLFLTANAAARDMAEAFASGADEYVVKPFRAPELGARIFSLLRRARS